MNLDESTPVLVKMATVDNQPQETQKLEAQDAEKKQAIIDFDCCSQQLGQLRAGKYTVHLFIQEGHSFKHENSESINPIVEVTCFGQTQFSTAQLNVKCNSKDTTYWREHLFFQSSHLEANQIAKQKIDVKLKNYGFVIDELIGHFVFDLAKIYCQKDHRILHKWFAITNPDSVDKSQLTGVMRASILVTHSQDELVELKNPNEMMLKDKHYQMIIPPRVRFSYKQLQVRFMIAEHMSCEKDDQMFITSEYANKLFKTDVKSAYEPGMYRFNYEFSIPLKWPLAQDRFIIKVMRVQKLQAGKKEEVFCSLGFDMNELVQISSTERGDLSWYNLQGAPNVVQGEKAQMMNSNPETASAWKGRILLYITCKDVAYPELEMKSLDNLQNMNIDLKASSMKKKYQIQADVGLGVELPGDKDFRVSIRIGEHQWTTPKPLEKKKGYCRWHHRFESQIIEMPHQGINTLGNVYVHLIDTDDVPISFCTLPCSIFTELQPKYSVWCVMKAGAAVGRIQHDYEAGAVQVRLTIVDVEKQGMQDLKTLWKEIKLPKRLKNVLIVRAFIFQCRGIPSNVDDISDPYISVWNQDGKTIRTKNLDDTTNPMFYEAKEFLIEFNEENDAPPVVLNLWDYNEDKEDKYLGRAIIRLEEMSKYTDFDGKSKKEDLEKVPPPKWHKIIRSNNPFDPACGEVLCSFVLVQSDFHFKHKIEEFNLNNEMKISEFQISIHAYGMRNLQSFGLCEVKKPFLKLDIKSLLPAIRAQATQNPMTEPGSGPNPNLNSLITFKCMLPLQTEYCPHLQVEVLDNIYKGRVQPLIGSFIIELGKIKQASKDRFNQEQAIIQQIIDYLKKFMQTDVDSLKQTQELRWQSARTPELNSVIAKKRDQLLNQNNPQIEEQKEQRKPSVWAKQEQTLILDDKKKQVREPLLQNDQELNFTRQNTWFMMSDTDKVTQLKNEIKDIEQEYKTLIQNKTMRFKIEQDDCHDSNIKQVEAQLMQKKLELQEEENTVQELERKADQILFKQTQRQSFGQTLLIPQYQKNIFFGVYNEVNKPPASLYQPIGYNNQNVTQDMMEHFKPRQSQNVDAEKLQLEKLQWQKKISHMHYRKYYNCELEKVKSLWGKDLNQTVFTQIDILRGFPRGYEPNFYEQKQLRKGIMKPHQKVGTFKGLIEVWNEQEMQQSKEKRKSDINQIYNLLKDIYKRHYKKDLPYEKSAFLDYQKQKQIWAEFEHAYLDVAHLKQAFNEQQSFTLLKQNLLTYTNCTVRLYVLGASSLANRDLESMSDPYLIIKCGDIEFNEREFYQKDTEAPQFNKLFQFMVPFPSAPTLQIQVMDFDEKWGDDLIGQTDIEMDDRFFSTKWQALEEKPIETRKLVHPCSQAIQGKLMLWLEIYEQNQRKTRVESKIWDLHTEPKQEFQCRVAVYKVYGFEPSHALGTSDIFVEGCIDPDYILNTDTHYRCTGGQAIFNYRMLFDFISPSKHQTLILRCKNRDLCSTTHQVVCEWSLDLNLILELVKKTHRKVHVNKQFIELNQGKMAHLTFIDDNTFELECVQGDNKITIQLDVRVFPKEVAQRSPVGVARSAPNQDPYLLPPLNRLQLKEPIKTLQNMLSPAVRSRINWYIAAAVCTLLLLMMIPTMLSDIIVGILGAIFYGKKQNA